MYTRRRISWLLGVTLKQKSTCLFFLHVWQSYLLRNKFCTIPIFPFCSFIFVTAQPRAVLTLHERLSALTVRSKHNVFHRHAAIKQTYVWIVRTEQVCDNSEMHVYVNGDDRLTLNVVRNVPGLPTVTVESLWRSIRIACMARRSSHWAL